MHLHRGGLGDILGVRDLLACFQGKSTRVVSVALVCECRGGGVLGVGEVLGFRVGVLVCEGRGGGVWFSGV